MATIQYKSCVQSNPIPNEAHHRSRNSITQSQGFTLVEVLVAMGIFSVTFLALAAGAGSVMRSNNTSMNSTIATNLAQDKVEELKAMTGSNIVTAGPVTDNVGGVDFTRTWTVTPNSPVPGVKQVDVTVSWSDYSGHVLTVSSAVMQ
ncbi:MAG TPA: prepilin-type N-terminal cleavage/methylation domain-containing protein [Candidatus Binatia bacterium]